MLRMPIPLPFEVVASPDRSFGNRGTLWSGIPFRKKNPVTAQETIHYVGGTAVGLHLLSSGSVSLVMEGWEYTEPWEDPVLSVRLVRFPPDGSPQEYGRSDGTLVLDILQHPKVTVLVAGCTTATGAFAALVAEPGEPTYSYVIYTVVSADVPLLNAQVTRRSVSANCVLEPQNRALPFKLGMAPAGAYIGIVSTRDTRVRVADLQGAGTICRDVDLAGSPTLPGLHHFEVASVRFDARSGAATIALTAFLNHPSVGSTSVGAVLRLLTDGSRDASFGDNGLWVSPLMLGYRDFVCAGEAHGIVAGVVGRRAVVFAHDPSDGTLDTSFGDGGLADFNLGAPLSAPVTASGSGWIYVFAQRVPTQADRAADLRTAGCRFHVTRAAADFGHVDTSWGVAGVVT